MGKISKAVTALTGLIATPVWAQATLQTGPMAEPNTGDTAWVLTASVLALLVTLPGLALFYAGRVRSKNMLSVLIQCGAIAASVSVLWVVIGYSLAFSADDKVWIGSAQNFMFNNMFAMRDGQTVGEIVFGLFQMGFAIIAPALIIGAYAERARFGWVVAFSILWSLIVYVPVARAVWGNGFLADQGVIDFAGGLVVQTAAGVSALVVALMMGRRIGFPKTATLPHSPALTLAGVALLWVGWLGLTGGAALSASDVGAASAMIVTHIAAASAALVWMLIERVKNGKVSVIGFATGAVAGLSGISAAAGSVGLGGAILIGLASAVTCYGVSGLVKKYLQIDDMMNVFAVNGIGGIVGSLLLAVFASEKMGGVGYAEGAGMASQLWIQLKAIAIIVVWSAVATLIIGYMVSMVLPMRVSEAEENEGLDSASHGERAWEFD